jgi:hypothetical protein
MTALERRILELCSLALAYADKKEFDEILGQLKAALIERGATRADPDGMRYPKSA